MTFDPTSVEVTCVTLPKDRCVQVPWEYMNVCGYSDQFCKNYHIHTHTYYIHTHTTYRISDHIVSFWTTFRRDKKAFHARKKHHWRAPTIGPFPWGGYSTSNQKLACFVFYLKIINTFWKKKKIYASKSKLSKELKNGTEILESQVVFRLWIQTVKILFWSITQEPFRLL